VICVDASVAGKWLFPEEHSARADALLRGALEQAEPIVAPPLLPSEVANIVRQRQRQGQLQLSEARLLLAHFLAVPISFEAPDALYDQALILADRHNLSAIYDAQYVALAELLGATLWTADGRLLRALGGTVPFVRWLADYGT
jgi:predicted nucleic acid-binding protein